jgi:hypothetical protein
VAGGSLRSILKGTHALFLFDASHSSSSRMRNAGHFNF